MKVSLVLLLLTPTLSFSKTCVFELNQDSLKVEWTAFKTPLKVGVKGSFKKLGTQEGKGKGSSLSKMFTDIPFNIETKTIDTGNSSRDKKIYKFFFKGMQGSDKISGKIINYKKKTLNLLINMNGKELNIPMKTTIADLSFTALGHIDVLDFALSSNLAAINKACYKLHEGKTWSDVTMALSGKYTKSCE